MVFYLPLRREGVLAALFKIEKAETNPAASIIKAMADALKVKMGKVFAFTGNRKLEWNINGCFGVYYFI